MAEHTPEPTPAAMSGATALLVLGMHRSGTSAITGALGTLGVPLGSRLLEAGPDNTSGYWEHRDAVVLDERLLRALGLDWDDPRELPGDWLASDAAARAGAEILALVASEFAGKELWALKDPRLCRLLPLWRREFVALGLQLAALLVLRHPDEVAASLLARDALPPAVSHLLLIRYLLDAEGASRGLPRAVVTYDRVLENPSVAFARIAVDLLLLWPRAPSACIEELGAFLDSGARHHVASRRSDASPPESRLDSPFRTAALELHALLERGVNDTGALAALDRFRGCFEVDLAAQQAWIDVLLEECRLRSTVREKIALRHASEHEMLQRRVHSTEAAQQHAESLALERLQEIAQLTARLRDTDLSLARRESESLARQAESETLGAQLATTQDALSRVEQLCVQRLREVERLDAELIDERACILLVRAEVVAARKEIAALHASFWWRLSTPMRRFSGWIRRLLKSITPP